MTSKQPKILPRGPVKYPIEEGPSISARKRIGTACNECRLVRRKCDGLRPSCSSCVQYSRSCQYGLDRRNRDSLRDTINKLEDMNRCLKDTNQQLRSELYSMGFGEAVPSSYSITQPTEATANLLFDTDYGKIPSESFAHKAAAAFFSGVAPLFYIIMPDDYNRLIHRIYQEKLNIERCEICELCAIAAVGCRYNSAQVPDEYVEIFWQQALLLVYDVIGEADVRALRILLCLGIYLILDKSISARAMIVSGINLARWCMPDRDSHGRSKLEWDGLFQTLATIECWLSFALGFEHSLTKEDTQYITECNDSKENIGLLETVNDATVATIYSQMWRSSFMAGELYKQIRSTPGLSWNKFEYISSGLDKWRQELPASLQLQFLTSYDSGPPSKQKQRLLLVHMIYLERRILLLHHFLQKHTESKLLQMSTSTRQTYTAFAHQLTGIISVIYREKWPSMRSWLVIHASFHCSITMLSIICQCHITGEDINKVRDTWTDIESCMEVLSYCSMVDSAAARLAHIVRSSSASLDWITDQPQATPIPQQEPMRIGAILNDELPDRRYLVETTKDIVHRMALDISSGS
ncbi:hypothetical protein BDV30DRAFT_215799 [Aspergillus minisclerotigenes]|uniref:Zn(2)-C6 fungal-type domain-containing protein n=1 Tax=Aspergillus minisclerotigenes TaxID=656917 RepID=A0A5N6IUL5_9EURO|nr:hypothetical protein BDV30DRAFT_215799 [Aspergillus minisclerotigenes]